MTTDPTPETTNEAPAPEGGQGSQSPSTEPPLQPGDHVRLERTLSYLKTADPMPMLRPPDLIDADEVGEVVEVRPLETVAARFRRGTFLISRGDLRLVAPDSGTA